MRYEATIEFEHRLKSNANLRLHYQAMAKVKSTQRRALREAWLAHNKPIPPMPCTVTFVRFSPGMLDDDNVRAAFKSMRDEWCTLVGLVSFGKKPRPFDESSLVTFAYEQVRTSRDDYRVQVRMESSSTDRTPLIPGGMTERMRDKMVEMWRDGLPLKVIHERFSPIALTTISLTIRQALGLKRLSQKGRGLEFPRRS